MLDRTQKNQYNKKSMKKDDYGREVYRSLAMISQFGINMIVPILLCGGLGLFLDRRLGTSWLAILLFFVGALAGFRNIYILARKIFAQDGETRRQRERNRRRIESKGDNADTEAFFSDK